MYEILLNYSLLNLLSPIIIRALKLTPRSLEPQVLSASQALE